MSARAPAPKPAPKSLSHQVSDLIEQTSYAELRQVGGALHEYLAEEHSALDTAEALHSWAADFAPATR